MIRKFLYLLIFMAILSCNRKEEGYNPVHAPFLQVNATWADSVLQELTMAEKIGQLLIWAPPSGLGASKEKIWEAVAEGSLSGMLLQNLAIDSFLQIADSARYLTRLPLLIGSGESVLLNNQFSDAVAFPSAATLSSIRDDSLIQGLEKQYVAQCNALGINFCLAPSLNRNHPNASCFDFKCLESQQEDLLWQSTRMMYQLQSQNILAIARDFKDLVYMPNDTSGVLDSILQPFLSLSINGLSGILSDPAIFAEDTAMRQPLDYLKTYTKEQLEFGGLHLAKTQAGIPIEKQFLAGVDLWLLSDSLEATTSRLMTLLENGNLSEQMLDEKVRRILQAKRWINQGLPSDFDQRGHIVEKLRDRQQEIQVRQFYESSLILAQNGQQILPFQNIANKRFRLVEVGPQKLSVFNKEFDFYTDYTSQLLIPYSKDSIAALDPNGPKHQMLVLTLDGLDLRADRHTAFIRSINTIAHQNEVVLVNFGNPFNLQFFDTTLAMIQVLERNPATETFVVQALFGGRDTPGVLPVAVSSNLPKGTGGSLAVTRLRSAFPEEGGIAAYKLVGIDAIARSAIANKAIPGCQVMVVKGGQVIYDKNFGYQDVHHRDLVESDDLYDVASITKVAATTIAIMKLYEKGEIRLNDPLSKHLDLGTKSPIRRITIKQLLTHQSGLQAYMPINPYVMARDSNSRNCEKYFCFENRPPFTVKVADSLFMDYHYMDTIWQDVCQIKPRRRKNFRYSDVNFFLLQKVVEAKTGKDLATYVQEEFYTPLDLRRTTFRPLERFAARDIIPTAYDEKWRKQVLRGYVHDETAALLDGVGGNAGLFSNAHDMAVLFQMLLNGGTSGGRRYLQQETVDLFTKTQYRTNRGLGFDKRNKSKRQACSPKASTATYGHTGFTGTCVWVDPANDLIFIFLTNRINEDYKNQRIFRDQVRRRMHSVVYDALDSFDPVIQPETLTQKQDIEKVEASLK